MKPLVLVTLFHIRRLPHYHCEERPIFITWRLAGTLPVGHCLSGASGERFREMDLLLDEAASGPLFLREALFAEMVVDAFRSGDGVGYELHNYVVMANHVHLLVTPHGLVSKLTQSLKRFTGRQGNLMLGRTGQAFWQDESFDRLVRDGREFSRIAAYIEMNPVRAGLVVTPEEFRWSSAYKGVTALAD